MAVDVLVALHESDCSIVFSHTWLTLALGSM